MGGNFHRNTHPANEYNISASLNGTSLEIRDNGGTIAADLSALQDGVTDADADPTNEIQDIAIVGDQLSITNGSTITLPDAVNDADADPAAYSGRRLPPVPVKNATHSGLLLPPIPV